MTYEEYSTRLCSAMAATDPPSSEAEIAVCCEYAANLYSHGLPVLFDSEHVQRVLKIKDICLQSYHVFNVSQLGKERLITAPSKPLKSRQKWILDNILNNIEISKYAHGFERGHSIVSNAMPHMKHAYAVCVDIKNFFPSIREDSVIRLFNRMGYSYSAAKALARICCYCGALPQGAPSSPRLANLICREMDEEIAGLADENSAVYTRYADDITISGNQLPDSILPKLEKILHKSDFYLNTEKTHFYGPEDIKRITGLVVHRDRIRVPKYFKRELKKEIHFCLKYGVQIHLENTRAIHYVHYREYMYGKAYYVKMVEPEEGEKLLCLLDQIKWPIYMLNCD